MFEIEFNFWNFIIRLNESNLTALSRFKQIQDFELRTGERPNRSKCDRSKCVRSFRLINYLISVTVRIWIHPVPVKTDDFQMIKLSWFFTWYSIFEYFNGPFIIRLTSSSTFQVNRFSFSMMTRKFALEIVFEKIRGFKTKTAVCFCLLLTRYSTINRFLDFTEIFWLGYNVNFVACFT